MPLSPGAVQVNERLPPCAEIVAATRSVMRPGGMSSAVVPRALLEMADALPPESIARSAK